MLDQIDAVTVIVLLFVAAAAWIKPMAAVTFLVAGSTPFYAVLHVSGVETSALLTGSVFATAGGVALLRFAIRNEFRLVLGVRVYLSVFIIFVTLWYVRWLQLPPSQSLDERTNQFTERALFFMFVFSVIPFLTALFAFRSKPDFASALRWFSIWGALALFVVILYWIGGQESQSENISYQRWEPVPSLTGIILTYDLGTGCLAFFLLTDGDDSALVRLARWFLAVGVVAVDVRVGERGPFGFLIFCLALYFATRTGRVAFRAIMKGAVILALLFFVAGQVAKVYGGSRALGGDEAAQSNEARTEILGAAVTVITEQPIVGWGGGLQGRVMGDQEWFYVHVSLLDPLIETGIVGALLVWGLYIRLGKKIVTLYRKHREVRVLSNLLIFTALESQVSGHVSMTKHFWFSTGMICCLTETLAPAKAGVVAVADPPTVENRLDPA